MKKLSALLLLLAITASAATEIKHFGCFYTDAGHWRPQPHINTQRCAYLIMIDNRKQDNAFVFELNKLTLAIDNKVFSFESKNAVTTTFSGSLKGFSKYTVVPARRTYLGIVWFDFNRMMTKEIKKKGKLLYASKELNAYSKIKSPCLGAGIYGFPKAIYSTQSKKTNTTLTYLGCDTLPFREINNQQQRTLNANNRGKPYIEEFGTYFYEKTFSGKYAVYISLVMKLEKNTSLRNEGIICKYANEFILMVGNDKYKNISSNIILSDYAGCLRGFEDGAVLFKNQKQEYGVLKFIITKKNLPSMAQAKVYWRNKSFKLNGKIAKEDAFELLPAGIYGNNLLKKLDRP